MAGRHRARRTRLGLLWQREARGLPSDEYARLRAEIVASVSMLADLVGKRRPELSRRDARLLSLFTYSSVCSVSYHPEELPRDRCEDVLRDIIDTILGAEPAPAQPPVDPEPPGLLPTARRERLLHAGIAGASIYYHFDSKQQLLAAALRHVPGVRRRHRP